MVLMRRKIFRFFIFFILLISGFVIFIIFIPKSYNVPELKERAGTQFWTLKTGSKIGYTFIHTKGEKKPYPVIFLQGGPGGPVYDGNIRTLSILAEAGYDIYLYDQIGCGYSDRLKNIEEYTVERHKKDLEEIVEVIGSEKVILLGQSWGAMLAAVFIADNPSEVEKVIFTGPGYILPVNYSLAAIPVPDSLDLGTPKYTNKQGREKIFNIRARAVEWCAKIFGFKLASDREMDEFETILDHEMGKSTLCDPVKLSAMENRSGFYSMIKTVQSFNSEKDIRPKLKNCTIPALIMRGQCDGIKWGFVTEYLDLFANHRLIIVPDAGHSIAREQPELYIKYILEFLN
jgi:proline iminopeptidase